MPSSVTEKTVLARKRWQYILVIIVPVVLITAGVLLFLNRVPHATLRVGTAVYHLEIAQTDAARTKGLGDRASLSADHGMLFVYPRSVLTCFWMKDTHFALDIMWTNAQKRVVHIAPNVGPSSYPHTYCTPTAAQYVIELSAGQAAKQHIQIGQQLRF